MTTNQSSMIGPNARPIRAVPSGCTANSASRIDDRRRQHIGRQRGAICSMPSSAESTEIAGVIAPSP